MATRALGTTAWEESVSVPRMVPFRVCPLRVTLVKRTKTRLTARPGLYRHTSHPLSTDAIVHLGGTFCVVNLRKAFASYPRVFRVHPWPKKGLPRINTDKHALE